MEIPASLAARPSYGGLPVPFVTAIIDGVPDFRVHDEANRRRCASRGLCQLCGERLDGSVVLIGFGGSVGRNSFGEPPMHEDCFAYAWENCPWLNGRDYREREREGVEWTPRPHDTMELGVVRALTTRTSKDALGLTVWHAVPPAEDVEWRQRAA